MLVFVDRWVDDSDVGKIGELPASDYVPKTIYLDDGKAVPICVVLAPRVTTPPAARRAGSSKDAWPRCSTATNPWAASTTSPTF